ncbi:MAG: amidohydrolase family protein [Alphaproteobacteria bacterium]|nr:amidohydrolase family protein [Alphaproteobacteria bacterium]
MNTHDTIIRNGLIYDGTAGAPFEADIAIDGGVITLVGNVDGKGVNEINANGQIVTPGFVDIHTHYDGQAAWGDTLDPSSLHGVTTAVMGNCGVGFAPVHETDHDRLIQLMEGVEDIPFPVLAEGLPWEWETFEDYLDFLTPRRFDIDLAAQVPHAAMRVYVMGERGANREDATDEDIAKMADLAHDAVMAGALGFSTSRTLNHRSADGSPTPTLTASEKELQGIASGLTRAGRGTLQFVSDFDDMHAEMAMLRRLVEQSGRPLSVSIAQADNKPTLWRHLTDWLEQGDADGLPMRGQVSPRPVGVLLGLELTLNPLSGHPSFNKIAKLPLAEKVAALSNTDFRAQLLSEEPKSENPFVRALLASFGKIFMLSDPPDYEPSADKTVAAIAKQRAISEVEVALDLMLQDGGRGVLYFPFLNFADGNLDSTRSMLESKASLPGLSDGGAHVGMICDGSFPTSLLTHWGRDRTQGPRLPLELLISKQTRDTAHWVGLHDRGILKPGYRADINVINFNKLSLHLPEVCYDLPTGGRRLMQRASGYSVTMVAGEVTYRNGAPTGAKPGKLVRGEQLVPPRKLAAE